MKKISALIAKHNGPGFRKSRFWLMAGGGFTLRKKDAVKLNEVDAILKAASLMRNPRFSDVVIS